MKRKRPTSKRMENLGPFHRALNQAVDSEYPKHEAFARAYGCNPSWISQILGGESVSDDVLGRLVHVISDPVTQLQLVELWTQERLPKPELPANLSAEQVVEMCEKMIREGFVRQALSLGEQELARSRDFAPWYRIARSVVPWNLRLGRVSRALLLQAEVEQRAKADGDRMCILTALAMKKTALRSVESVTPGAIRETHMATMAFAQSFRPKPAEEADYEYRMDSIWREFALDLLRLYRMGKLPASELDSALKAVDRSLKPDAPALYTAGLEVRARIETDQGRTDRTKLFAAEETLEELEGVGLENWFELWEKTNFTKAKILELRGETDGAIEVLQEIRDHGEASENWSAFRKADQEVARILVGL